MTCQHHLQQEMSRLDALNSQQIAEYEARLAELEKKLLLIEPERLRLKELDEFMQTVDENQKVLRNDVARDRKRCNAMLQEINKVLLILNLYCVPRSNFLSSSLFYLNISTKHNLKLPLGRIVIDLAILCSFAVCQLHRARRQQRVQPTGLQMSSQLQDIHPSRHRELRHR